MKPRMAIPTVIYNSVDMKEILNDRLEAFSYVDEASGSSDTISITLENADKKWLNEWFPEKGDKIMAYINKLNWEKQDENQGLYCGSFMVDDFDFSGRPLTVNIKGISSPRDEGFASTKRSKVWEQTNLKSVASEIASRSGISLTYDADDIPIKVIEQNEQVDSDFLKKLCDKYGLAMKTYANKIVIYDIAKYDKKDAIITIDESEMIDWSFKSTITGTYTGGKMQYTDAKTNKEYVVTVGDSKRLLEVNEKADSLEDARKQIVSKVNTANREEKTMSITIMAKDGVVATSNVAITGLGKADGKYSIDKVTHDLGSNYTMKLELKGIGGNIDGTKFSISENRKSKRS